ncbi:MAG: hypothetical protein BWY26_00577 [Elusimicrobia bacterium ADurb.Bin231]|nr:MAG: hypothetical protein BWY26_00577 [Elusimicrobia bacterium ADurb.Bin231]
MKKSSKKKKRAHPEVPSVSVDVWSDFYFQKPEILIAFSIFIIVCVVYILLPCKMFYFDGLMYAAIVEARDANWKSRLPWANHLSFNYYGHAFWRFFQWLGFKADGYRALQTMNALFSAAVVGLFYLFIRKLTEKRYVAIIFSFLLAFSYSFWYRAVDAQVYPPSVFWLCVTLILLWSFMRLPSLSKVVAISVATGLSILAHQGNIFFLPAVAYGIIYSGKAKLKNLLLFAVLSGLIVGIPYIRVLAYHERTLADPATGEIVLNKTTIKNSFNWLRGNANDYTPDDDKYVNQYWAPDPKHLLTNFKTVINAMWYTGQYGYGSSTKTGKIMMAVSGLIFILLAIFLFIRQKTYKKQKELFIVFAIWWVSYMAFVSWFNPGNPDYWYHHWIPILALFACSFSDFMNSENYALSVRRIVAGVLMGAIAVIPAVNFKDAILPISKIENNENYMRSLWIKENVVSGGIIIISGIGWSNPQKVYIPAFSGVKPIAFDLLFVFMPKVQGLATLRNQLEILTSQGTPVYALSEIFSKETEEGLKQWNVSMDEIKEVFDRYDLKNVSDYKDGMKLNRVIPKPGGAAYFRNSALTQYNAGNFSGAIKYFTSIPTQSRYFFDYKVMGYCFLRMNNIPEAVKNWKIAASMNPGDKELAETLRHYGQ